MSQWGWYACWQEMGSMSRSCRDLKRPMAILKSWVVSFGMAT